VNRRENEETTMTSPREQYADSVIWGRLVTDGIEERTPEGGWHYAALYVDGTRQEAWWDAQVRLHRADGPAAQTVADDGTVLNEMWRNHGHPGRKDGGPTDTQTLAHGGVRERWAARTPGQVVNRQTEPDGSSREIIRTENDGRWLVQRDADGEIVEEHATDNEAVLVAPITSGELRARRTALGFSVTGLARSLGVSQARVSQWETRRRVPAGIADELATREAWARSLRREVEREAERTGVITTYRTDAEFWAAGGVEGLCAATLDVIAADLHAAHGWPIVRADEH